MEIPTVGGKYSATNILIVLPLRSPFQCCLRSMPKAVLRNLRAIVMQLVTNIETGNEKGYGHCSCRIFSAYGPEFPLISSSNDEIMLRNIFRLPLGRLFYCIRPFGGTSVCGVHCAVPIATPHDLRMRPSWPFKFVCLFRRPCILPLSLPALRFLHQLIIALQRIFSISQNPMTRRKALQHR